jgi:hypothetical protein
LAIGLASGHPGIGLGIAAGALDTMFSDQPGPYRQRLARLLLASLAAGLASLIGFLIGDQLIPMLVATAVFGFLGGLVVVFGPDMTRVGMTSMILLVVTAATPRPLSEAIGAASLIFAGGLLLTVFSVAAWPLQRYRPERHALGAVYRGLSSLARQQAHDDADVPALTDAMTTLQHTLLGRHHARGRAMEAFGVLLELAERIRLELTAMAELRASASIHAMFRGDAARVLAAIADALEAGEPPTQAERALQTLQASEKAWPRISTHCPASSPPRCVTRTGPAVVANFVRPPPKRRCLPLCAAVPRAPRCAPISRRIRWHSAMRCAAPSR